MDLSSELNPQQREAVLHVDGPLLLLAGAGSGKTRVITYRIAHLIKSCNVPPESILAVTFTNKAAEEMRKRVLEMLNEDHQGSPRLSTFHSFCTRLLRSHAPLIGFSRDFSIFDSNDQTLTMKACLKELSISESLLTPRRGRSVISLAKNSLRTIGGGMPFPGHRDADLYVRVLDLYSTKLRRANAMDFDDLLLNALIVLRDHQDVREMYHHRIQYLLIDEYQDTNLLQYQLAKYLTHPPYNICAVGDEDQSIYRFRGSNVENIRAFEKDYPNVVVLKLEQNYRSTQRILEAASSLVQNNLDRKDKTLWTRNDPGDLVRMLENETGSDEADVVSRIIRGLKREGQDESFAVLYRTNFQSRYFEEAFKRDAIPFNLVGGFSFYARAEIKDLIAYLRLCSNPKDGVALERIINKPARGIGASTLDRLKSHAASEKCGLWEAVSKFAQDSSLSGRSHRRLAEFVHLVQQLQSDMPSYKLSRFIERVTIESGYLKMLQNDDSPEAQSRLGNIEELVTAAEEWESQGLNISEFLDRASLASETDNYDPERHVTMMTLHSAKGLEFDVVFVVGMEEGLFPHAQSLNQEADVQEERRLCYVGMTRARRRLFLSWARHRRSFSLNSSSDKQPSRFLSEVPSSIIESIQDGYSSRETSWHSPFQVAPSPARSRKSYSGRSYNTKESVVDFLRKKRIPKEVRSRGWPQRPADPGGPEDFPPGTRVQHARFGEGCVLQAAKEGGEMRLIIHFQDHGKKKLIQRYSNLVKI